MRDTVKHQGRTWEIEEQQTQIIVRSDNGRLASGKRKEDIIKKWKKA